jgi:DNA-binding MarR family transcriptional regulator
MPSALYPMTALTFDLRSATSTSSLGFRSRRQSRKAVPTSGLTAGAITGALDRLETAGFARRVPDPADRRRVKVEVTPAFYASAERIWSPLAFDWESTLSKRFTIEELARITDFLRATNEIGRRHLDRLRRKP